MVEKTELTLVEAHPRTTCVVFSFLQVSLLSLILRAFLALLVQTTSAQCLAPKESSYSELRVPCLPVATVSLGPQSLDQPGTLVPKRMAV